MKLVGFARIPLMALGLHAALSGAMEIGRTSLQVPGAPWEVLVTYETQVRFSGFDGQNTIPVQNTVFQLPGQKDTPRALLIVASTTRGYRTTVRWRGEGCPAPRPRYYTEHFGSNVRANVGECLIVNSAFAPFAFFKSESEVLKALDEKGLKLFKAGYSMRTMYAAQIGTVLRVHLLTQRDFKGLAESAAVVEQTHDVPLELVRWGYALHKAVQESAQSVSGKLVIPPIEFKD